LAVVKTESNLKHETEEKEERERGEKRKLVIGGTGTRKVEKARGRGGEDGSVVVLLLSPFLFSANDTAKVEAKACGKAAFAFWFYVLRC
jgi:hypothetical protein